MEEQDLLKRNNSTDRRFSNTSRGILNMLDGYKIVCLCDYQF
jgi:hypothetical protein